MKNTIENKIKVANSRLKPKQKKIVKKLGSVKLMKLCFKITSAMPFLCKKCRIVAQTHKFKDRESFCVDCRQKNKVKELIDYIYEIKAESEDDKQ